MKARYLIPALLAAATFSASALAHDGDRDGWRHDHRRYYGHHHRHAHMPPPPPPAYWRHNGPPRHEYRDERHYRYEQPAANIYLPLPPSPHEVHRAIRDSLFGR